jgi:hypothetical protein
MFGWILFAIAVLCFLPMYILSRKIRNRLVEYVTLLLCSQSFYKEQHAKFAEFVNEQQASSAVQLSASAVFAVESMANHFSEHTPIAAHTTLWTYRKALVEEKAQESPPSEPEKAKATSNVN